MNRYTITLNFFLPERLVETLRQVQISQVSEFDWRDSGLFHCTVKDINAMKERPDSEVLGAIIETTTDILHEQQPFVVEIKDVSSFPNVLYANVYSEQLVGLHNRLCSNLPGTKPEFEGSNFIPHITFAILGEEVVHGSLQPINFGSYEVRELQLVVWDQKELDKPEIVHRFKL